MPHFTGVQKQFRVIPAEQPPEEDEFGPDIEEGKEQESELDSYPKYLKCYNYGNIIYQFMIQSIILVF